MGERTKYAPGTFSWTDLTTPNQDAAKDFYVGLFGWTADDRPVSEGVTYSMMQRDGKEVAAIAPQPQQQRDAGARPAWNSYITVRSADEALSRAAQLGASVHAPAFDVFDAGRMGVVQDPQGAFFSVWEPRSTIGARYVNGPGAMCWNELASPDLEASARFYGDLFGWTTEAMPGQAMEYLVIKNSEGRDNGAIRPALPPGSPPFWLVYFGIDDLEAGLAKVEELGGSTVAEPIQITPSSRIAVAQDADGAVFALFSGHFDE
jgi:uncharacterized protein